MEWGFDIEKGPDGKSWVTLTVGLPFTRTLVAMPVEAAEQLRDQLPDALGTVISRAKAANGDTLAVASTLDLSTFRQKGTFK